MSRQLLVHGDKTFKVTIPDDARVTFAPFSPPRRDGYRDVGVAVGTLRVYQGAGEKNVLAVWSGVHGFRDMGLGYAEEVAKEEGATIWKDDAEGYMREEKVTSQKEWIDDPVPALEAPKPTRKRTRKAA